MLNSSPKPWKEHDFREQMVYIRQAEYLQEKGYFTGMDSLTDKEDRDKELWSIIRYYEKIIKINSTERIREVNRRAYFQVKGSAEFMCVDTSTWKDPE